jgi:hypothetical protein
VRADRRAFPLGAIVSKIAFHPPTLIVCAALTDFRFALQSVSQEPTRMPVRVSLRRLGDGGGDGIMFAEVIDGDVVLKALDDAETLPGIECFYFPAFWVD